MPGPAPSRRAFLSAAAGFTSTARAQRQPPNVVLIFADDLGYGDLGCYGSKLATPNLDRLAAGGAQFTHYTSANPVCSPSRAALLTGRYPTRVGVPNVLFPNAKTGLALDETTLAQTLRASGYRTMCIGKWHLGDAPEYLPTARGFDEYFGIPYSNDMNPRVLMRNTDVIEQTATLETLTPRYTEQAVRFIERSKGSPFFLYFPHTYPHIPLAASERFRGKSPFGLYGDVVAELDWSVGEVVAALRRNGVAGNTMVLFSSDNGPWFQGSPGLLRGRKGSTWEGGVRVPFIANFPGRIPAGLVSDALVSAMDVMPTVAHLCGAKLPDRPLDGIDLWPLLAGRRKSVEREAVLYFDGVHVQCARLGPWKLHLARYNSYVYGPAPAGGRKNLPLANPELYNVVHDPAESYDAAAGHPEIVRDIMARVKSLLASFPEPIQAAYAATRGLEASMPPAGHLPQLRPAAK
ncbi:MAG TPA: sulfatase [Bryobacteraceae bacterium]|nr:sulfatase [Bryobacteraceae bacterium]